ncbi:MAG: hypothetical protein PUB45_01495 [Bacteroidales bacterium]|nr:hypothetical protein [Bacteroidales bacterium]
MMRTLKLSILVAAIAVASSCDSPAVGDDPVERKKLHLGDLAGGGVVVFVDPVDSTAGRVLELGYAEELTWSDLGERIGCLSRSDGRENTALIRASSHYPENYPAMMHCDELGQEWYLPSLDEWMSVYTAWNGSSSKTADVQARERFDAILESAGAAVMNPNPETTTSGQSYWTSTESELTNAEAYYFKFGSMATGTGTKKSRNRLTRCMRVIGELTPAPQLSLSAKSVTIGAEAGSFGNLNVTTNYDDLRISFPDEVDPSDWLDVSVSTFLGTTTVIFKALTRNEGRTFRSANVTITAGPELMSTSRNVFVQQEPGITVVSHLREVHGGGVVVWQNPENETDVKIMSLKRLAATGGWCDVSVQNVPTGALDQDDGESNTAKILALDEADKFYAAQYCASMGEGWYLPSKNELQSMFATVNGVSSWEACEKGTPASLAENYPQQYSARVEFEKILTDNGGDPFNSKGDDTNGDSYWSSTESAEDVTKAYYLRVGALDNATMAKRGGARFARCFKKMTLQK